MPRRQKRRRRKRHFQGTLNLRDRGQLGRLEQGGGRVIRTAKGVGKVGYRTTGGRTSLVPTERSEVRGRTVEVNLDHPSCFDT